LANLKTLDLLEKVRLGDEQAKEQVVKDNLGLVWSIVHRFKNNYYDKEELHNKLIKNPYSVLPNYANKVWGSKKIKYEAIEK